MPFTLRMTDDYYIKRPMLLRPENNAHKYSRGHAVIISGAVLSTGASRLSAQAALAVGAGLVSIIGEDDALREHAAHVTAIMLKSRDAMFSNIDDRVRAIAIGPAAGIGAETRDAVLHLLSLRIPIVLDADALTSFADRNSDLMAGLHNQVVLTPHIGEFSSVFPDIILDNHIQAAMKASCNSNAVVLLKGFETIIAAPDGRLAINRHASPWLATAGSGDILTGLICGLMAQGTAAFDAACIAAWLHGDIGVHYGPGLTGDNMIGQIPLVLRRCMQE